MTYGPLYGVNLLGAGEAFPARELDNEDILAMLPSEREMSAERRAFIARGAAEMLGLERRFWAYDPTKGKEPVNLSGEDSATLATLAAKRALEDANLAPHDIDAVIVTTSTPHRYTATVSAEVSRALGIRATCFDLRAGCSSGVTALGQLAMMLQNGHDVVMLIGTETFSAVIPSTHRTSALSLGDGAGALVIGRGQGILRALHSGSDGAYRDLVTTPGAMPPAISELERDAYRLTGDPEALGKIAIEKYVSSIDAIRRHASVTFSSIDAFIPHQTSTSMITRVCERSALDMRMTYMEGVPRHANIGSAGWIVSLGTLWRERRVASGDTVLIAAVGGGLSWGAALWTL